MDNARQQSIFKLTVIGIFLVAIALRMSLFFRSLQYDELWSLQFFAPLAWKNILLDLSLPNNHPLNTLGIKFISNISDNIFCIRLFPMLCGILLPLPAAFAMSIWCNDKRTGFIMGVLTALSAPLIIYSALARGYIIQAFFFVLTASGFACFSSSCVKKYARIGFLLIVTGGTGTILSVPTGIVFLAGLAAAVFIANGKKRPHKLVILALIAGLVFSTIYYLATYSALVSAQKWSVGGNYFASCGTILLHTGCGLLIASIIAVVISPRQTLTLILIPFIVLLSGAFTGLGPVRTYIIFAIVFSAAGAIAISRLLQKELRFRIAAIILLLLFAACQIYNAGNFLLPDWQKADVKNSSTTISVYPANSSYPLLWNLGMDFISSYQNTVGKSYLDTVKVYAPCGVFNGMDNSFCEKQIKTDLHAADCGTDNILGEYHCYKLELCESSIPGKGYFLIAYPPTPYRITPPENALRLNPHFESAGENRGRCALYFTNVPPSPHPGANIYLIK